MLPREIEPEVETKVLAEPPAEAPDLTGQQSAQTLGRYELVQRLGHGGMATVYLALTRGLGNFQKLVAVKVIHPHLANEPAFVDMFLSEARIAALLHNPHIGEVLDIGRSDGLYYMVMEYIEGETLSALTRLLSTQQQRLPVPAVVQILADTCYGLDAVHELRDTDGNPLGLVHRDVSPQNLLITLAGWVKLVDFGIAKAAGRESSTLTGCLRGKLPYMPPEQAQGKPLTRETDLFAVGVIGWELLAGRRLFSGANEAETLKHVLACEIEPLANIRPDVPRELCDLLHRMLSRDPEDRLDSAALLRRELLTVLRTHFAGSQPRTMLAKWMQTHFGERHAYRRASVRRTAKHPVIRVVDPTESNEFTPPRTLSLVPPLRDESHAALPVEDVHTQNRNTGGTWPMWLGLPLVGATIAGLTIYLSGVSAKQSPAPVAVEQPAPQKPATPEPRTSSQAEVSTVATPPETVAWVIQTDPPGATITVVNAPATIRTDLEQAVADSVTPMRLELPKGSTEVELTLTKHGFEPVHDLRMPLADANLSFALKPKRPKFRTPLKSTHKHDKPPPETKKPPPDPLETPTFEPLKTKQGHSGT